MVNRFQYTLYIILSPGLIYHLSQEFFKHMYRYFKPDEVGTDPPKKIKHKIRLESPVKEEEEDAQMYIYDSKGTTLALI